MNTNQKAAQPVAPLHEEGSFYAVAKARGFTDFGLTLKGDYSDEKLQALREQYDDEASE